jgi:hypothetical protein
MVKIVFYDEDSAAKARAFISGEQYWLLCASSRNNSRETG